LATPPPAKLAELPLTVQAVMVSVPVLFTLPPTPALVLVLKVQFVSVAVPYALATPPPPAAVFAELSDLAEACLVFTARLLGHEQLTIIALGKFGGREISYGTDLDVVFVGEDNRTAQGLIAAMAQPTGEGNIWPLDARLRPEGENGPLVCSIETYQWYYGSRAQLWEMQALTRARGITGPLKDQFIELAKAAWRRASQDAELFLKIEGMLERIRRERGSGSDFLDLKTGNGGIIEGEFIVQALAMRENVWEPNSQRALERLREREVFSDGEVTKWNQSYEFLRQCESALRRYENKPVSSLPNDPSEERKLAVRLGLDNLEGFRRRYVDARESIHALYERHVASRNRGSALAFQRFNPSISVKLNQESL